MQVVIRNMWLEHDILNNIIYFWIFSLHWSYNWIGFLIDVQCNSTFRLGKIYPIAKYTQDRDMCDRFASYDLILKQTCLFCENEGYIGVCNTI